jgi:hypothetical protein
VRHRTHPRSAAWCLAALICLSSACGGGSDVSTDDQPWQGATALSAKEDYPSGVVIDGADVLYTTGLTQVGDHAVRIAPLDPASPATSRVLVADPGGTVPNGALAVDDGDVYVAAGSSVERVSVATGHVTSVVGGRPTLVDAVAVDDRYVWWTTFTYKFPAGAEVARIPKGGGPVEILAAGVDGKGRVYQDEPARQAVAVPEASAFRSLLLDGDAALVASGSVILRVAAGRPPQAVVDASSLGGAVTYIAADADRIYGEIAGGHDSLFAAPRSGGSPVELARDADNVKGIAVAGDEVLFMVHSPGSGGRDAIRAVAKTGGPARVVTSGRNAAGDLAVTADRVVFSADSRVWSAPLGGA